MKICAGWAKGQILKAPKSNETRPTSAKVKEAIFSILAESVVNARVLDLFSGTGGLGLEAISRGASSVHFIESHGAAYQCLTKNIDELKRRAVRQNLDEPQITARKSEVGKWLSKNQMQFDLIFTDPPYKDTTRWFEKISAQAPRLLTDNGIWVCESMSNFVPTEVKHVQLFKNRIFGETAIWLWVKS